MIEKWRDVVGYESYYQVSNFGRVRSKDRVETWQNVETKVFKNIKIRGRIFKAHRCPTYGYVRFHVGTRGKRGLVKSKQLYVHRLVAEAFLEKPLSKMHTHVNHKNGIKHDNCVENLEWMTASQNTRHSYNVLKNKASCGEDRWNTKLKNKDVVKILKLGATGTRQCDIANRFGVSRKTICMILNGKNWKHISL